MIRERLHGLCVVPFLVLEPLVEISGPDAGHGLLTKIGDQVNGSLFQCLKIVWTVAGIGLFAGDELLKSHGQFDSVDIAFLTYFFDEFPVRFEVEKYSVEARLFLSEGAKVKSLIVNFAGLISGWNDCFWTSGASSKLNFPMVVLPIKASMGLPASVCPRGDCETDVPDFD